MSRETLILLLIYFSVNIVSGLNCYQCNSTLDSNCAETFDHRLENNPLQPKACTIYLAQYCVKVTGIWGGIVGTHRFCSSKDLGDRCQNVIYPDHDRMYRPCVHTCSADGCNSAATYWTKRTIAFIITSVFVSMKMMKF